MIKNKKAAMEMSVGTLVTIVLLMVVLVLGVVLIRSIFSGSQDAVENINNQVIDEINKVFSDETREISIAPASRSITLDKTGKPAGFAFSVRNNDVISKAYSYAVTAVAAPNCGSLTPITASGYVQSGSGNFDLEAGTKLAYPRLVLFDIPDNAPPCTIEYNLKLTRPGKIDDIQIFVTIK